MPETKDYDEKKDKNVLNLQPGFIKMDAIRAFARLKNELEQKIRQENLNEEEMKALNEQLNEARDQCLAILGRQEVVCCCQGCGTNSEEDTRCQENVCCQENSCCQDEDVCVQEEEDFCATNHSQEEIFPGEESLCPRVGNTSFLREDDFIEAEASHGEDGVNEESLKRDQKSTEMLVQDVEDVRKGVCGFGWLCF